MRIDRIDAYHVAMPLIEPWRTAYGEDAVVESVLVQMFQGDVSAWGESSPLAAPCYSPEFAAGVFRTVADWLAPALLGQNVETAAALHERLRAYKGNPFAKAALDTAWWSLESKRTETPLAKLLGSGRERASVEVGADFGVMDSVAELLERVGQAVDAGFPRVKLKFRPGWDLDMLRAVRTQHPEHPIHIDCNAGYRLSDLDLFRQIDRLHLAMIEQPLAHDDLLDHAKLQAAIETPVCLDESLSSLTRARQAIELGSCRFANLKPGRIGGLEPARQAHDLFEEAGIGCWVGGMLESSVGANLCVALAMLPNCTYPPDIFPSSRFYREDLATPPLTLTRNDAGRPCVEAAPVAGNPALPHPERLDRWTTQRVTLTA